MMIMLLMMTTTMMFMFISHPLTMGMTLLIQTLLIAMWIGLLSMNFWYSYILFIIMVGGMLILFIYMTSVASNEKFKFKIMPLMTTMMLLMTSTIMFKNKMFPLMNSDTLTIKSKLMFTVSLNKFLMYPMMMMSLTIIIYLLIALIAVSKITNIKSGPLRKNI
uniref:NADH-ubiquinone oxidoreductase chain 6 n=1 Tax=Nipponoluciola cruciata TaxID=7051 RepID=T2HQQ9_NIPCR|nr:NADH dehydrogenase subunit 6 [Nipponoluciola cruciata]BAN82551.1 NADH dehydrogenase subunit 6 [Nipponoluciola cruciata]BDE56956.1 NADH dehydrogenase subunit 6 [Nipponoluciola cruciata]